MTTIENRLAALEKAAIQSKPIEPMPIFILPEEGNPERADIQAKIDALESAGKKVIVIVRPSARV
jgi:hypothetical protein